MLPAPRMDSPTPPPPRPTPGAERLHALDALRGMAILGVLVAYTVWSLGNPPEESWSRADRWVARGMDLLVDNKFLSTFAFLFGVGVAQQWRRWQEAGRDPRPLHLRRMAFLLGIGVLHAVLLRNGDILAPYALLGLALLGVRRAPTWVAATAAVCMVFLPSLVRTALTAAGVTLPARPSGPAGNYWVENFAWLRYWYATNPLLYWWDILALMIAGVLAGRARLIERLATDARLARRTLIASGILALLTRLAVDLLAAHWTGPPSPVRRATMSLLFDLSSWTLAATYGAALLLLARNAAAAAALAPLRAVGRMAFTNYLLQGLILVPLCLAFGWFDTVTPTRGLWMAVAIGALQLGFSTWWLGRFAMGPFERLWRGATYGSGQVSLR